MKGKDIHDFEEAHGKPKIKQLEEALAQEKTKIENLLAHKKRITIDPQSDNTIFFAITSDRHIGSLYHNGEALAAFYEYCHKEGIQIVFDAGDMVDGHRVYKGHEFELRDLGFDRQLERITKESPRQINTKFITGNHDASFKNLAGVEIGHQISALVPEYEYLGDTTARYKWITPNGEFILDLLHPGGGTAYALCFDDATEILTDDGWKLFSGMKNNDRVATLSDDGFFEWQQPTDYTNQHYNGEMIHFKARCFDLLVTPNHRMWTRRYPTRSNKLNKDIKSPQKARVQCDYSWKFVEAKDLLGWSKQSWQMQRGGVKWNPIICDSHVSIPRREPKKYASTTVKHFGDIDIYDAAELIAWFVTEGSVHSNKKQFAISQSNAANPENHALIVNLFQRLGTNVCVTGMDNKDISVSSVELCEWLEDQCGNGSANKKLPVWLKNQPQDVLRVVFDTMIRGDGWVSGVGFGYKSISKLLREDFGEVATKLGYGVTFVGDTVSVSSTQIYPTINTEPSVVRYDGRIYCVTVPNSRILVRRNGRTIWSGNSYKPQKIVDALEGGTKPDMLAIGHFHKAEVMPTYRNVCTIQAGTFQMQTPFMSRQGSQAHVGGWLVQVTIGRNKANKIINTRFVAFYR
jgi:hypothetical protein